LLQFNKSPGLAQADVDMFKTPTNLIFAKIWIAGTKRITFTL